MKSLNETSQLIRDEHKRLRGLFRQLEGLEPRDGNQAALYRPVIDELCDEIQAYLEAEERVFFPRLHLEIKKRAGGGETPESESIHQCLTDHAEIARAIYTVRAMLAGAPTVASSEFRESLEELRSLTEAHIYGDERELLPVMERWFPRADAELSMQWFDVIEQARARIGATDPSQPGHAQNPRGGEQRRKAS